MSPIAGIPPFRKQHKQEQVIREMRAAIERNHPGIGPQQVDTRIGLFRLAARVAAVSRTLNRDVFPTYTDTDLTLLRTRLYIHATIRENRQFSAELMRNGPLLELTDDRVLKATILCRDVAALLFVLQKGGSFSFVERALQLNLAVGGLCKDVILTHLTVQARDLSSEEIDQLTRAAQEQDGQKIAPFFSLLLTLKAQVEVVRICIRWGVLGFLRLFLEKGVISAAVSRNMVAALEDIHARGGVPQEDLPHLLQSICILSVFQRRVF